MRQQLSSAGEDGASTVSTSAGFLVFLFMLFTATHILFSLYASSMVTAATYQAAQMVAGFDSAADRCAAVVEAEARFVEMLGDYGEAGYAELIWTCTDPEAVTVQVIADHPTFLPPRLAGLIDIGHIDRTIVVRLEAFT
jgi:hypothetical protein